MCSVIVHLVPPNIITDPVSVISIVRESSQLACEASGSPLPTIEWLKDEQLVTSTSRVSVTSSVHGLVRTSNITLTNLNFTDTGNYTCRATNNLTVLQTTDSRPALLTVNRTYLNEVILCECCYLFSTLRSINDIEYNRPSSS